MKIKPAAFIRILSLVIGANVLASTGAATQLISVQEILEKAMDARGGNPVWSNIHSFRAGGTIFFQTQAGPWWSQLIVTNAWPFETSAMRPDKFQFFADLKLTQGASSVFIPPRYYENGFDGQTAWETLPGNPPEVLQGILGQERREQAQFFGWCDETQNYLSATNLGVADFEGHRCFVVKFTKDSGNPETHYYDITNNLLIGIDRSSVFGPSLERFILEDYRESGGFKFPMLIRYQAQDERDEGYFQSIERLNFLEVNCVTNPAFAMSSNSVRISLPEIHRTNDINDQQIKKMLHDWVDSDKFANGIAVGLLDEHGPRVISQGRLSPRTYFNLITVRPKVDGNTVFTIASITKVFTRLLLLDMVQRGEMRLDDPVQEYLPAYVHMPTHNGKQITLLHLATHTSGLPLWVGNSDDLDSFDQTYAALSHYSLNRDPGAEYEYSNIGIDLLGKAIERKAGKPFPTLVLERICRPLGMNHTTVINNPAGGVESTANDMLKLAAACLGPEKIPLDLIPLLQNEYITHGGDGAGDHSYLVVDHLHPRALVTLAESSHGYYDAVRGTLNRLILNECPEPFNMVKMDSALYDRYLGLYLSDDDSIWTVRREKRRLLVQELGGPSCEVFPLSTTNFLNQMTGLSATFIVATPSRNSQLVLHDPNSNWNWRGAKISTEAPVRSVIVKLPPAMADDCSGQYKDPSGNLLIVRHEGDRFTAQINGAGPMDTDVQDLAPESKSAFTSLTGPAVFTFLRNNSGRVTGLICHSYNHYLRYTKFAAPPPPPPELYSDKFLGTWEGMVGTDQKQVRATIKIFKIKNSYQATLSIADYGVKNNPFQTIIFTGNSTILLACSSGDDRATFSGSLNASATEIVGKWQEGDLSIPVSFKWHANQRR